LKVAQLARYIYGRETLANPELLMNGLPSTYGRGFDVFQPRRMFLSILPAMLTAPVFY
jgi:hypothetical protein